jgi:histidine triad (HIT) family protein
MNSCVFCLRVEAGEFDRTEVISVVSFEPLNPVVPGHRLFIPREHTESALRRPDLAGEAFMAAALHGKSAAAPCNLITSAGPEATQTIRHLHVHYVPRRQDDGLPLPWTPQQEAARA